MTLTVLWRLAGLVLAALLLLLVSKYVWPEGLLHLFTHELGFAFLISAVLWIVFEVHLANRSEQIWERRIEHMTKNVFEGVLRKDLPQGLIDEVQRMILDAEFVRSNYQIEYNLRDTEFLAAEGIKVPSVEMTVRLQYTLKNITKRDLPLELKIVLPNPIHPELKKMCKVSEFEVSRQGGQKVEFDLNAATKLFKDALNGENRTEVPFALSPINVSPGESVSVVTEYSMPKEAEDSELLEMLYPGDGLSMSLHDRGVAGARVIYARSVHRLQIESTCSDLNPETKYLRIDEYVLPSQGLLIWWKRTPPH